MKMARMKHTGTATMRDEPISGLTWAHREVKLIPVEVAEQLLVAHPHRFRLMEIVEVIKSVLPEQMHEEDPFMYQPPQRLDLLTRDALVQLAMAKFGRALDASREQVQLVQDVRHLYEEHKFRRVH